MPSLTPAASPKGLSTRPTRPHDYPTKRCTRVLIFAPPARRLRFEQLQSGGQPTAPVAPLQTTRKGTGKLAARRKWRPLARFGSMTRGSSGGATQIRQARGGIRKIEVMWYMGLKKGPLNGLLWVFRVFLLLGGLLNAMAGYYPLDIDHTTRAVRPSSPKEFRKRPSSSRAGRRRKAGARATPAPRRRWRCWSARGCPVPGFSKIRKKFQGGRGTRNIFENGRRRKKKSGTPKKNLGIEPRY